MVNLDYLESILPQFDLNGKPEQFKRLYEGLEKAGQIKDTLSDEGKLFSFLNVAVKIVKTENVMFGGGRNDENLISRFISNDFVDDDSDSEESSEESNENVNEEEEIEQEEELEQEKEIEQEEENLDEEEESERV